jgi:hypothetical protein
MDDKHIPQAGDTVACSNCGAPLGVLVEATVNNHSALCLQAGGIILRYGYGECKVCRRTQLFNANDIVFDRLIRAIIR